MLFKILLHCLVFCVSLTSKHILVLALLIANGFKSELCVYLYMCGQLLESTVAAMLTWWLVLLLPRQWSRFNPQQMQGYIFRVVWLWSQPRRGCVFQVTLESTQHLRNGYRKIFRIGWEFSGKKGDNKGNWPPQLIIQSPEHVKMYLLTPHIAASAVGLPDTSFLSWALLRAWTQLMQLSPEIC